MLSEYFETEVPYCRDLLRPSGNARLVISGVDPWRYWRNSPQVTYENLGLHKLFLVRD